MQSLQYKNLCKAVWVEARGREQTKARGKEHYTKSKEWNYKRHREVETCNSKLLCSCVVNKYIYIKENVLGLL